MELKRMYRGIFLCFLMLFFAVSNTNAQIIKNRSLVREKGKLFVSYDNGRTRSLVNERVVTVKLKPQKSLCRSLIPLRSNQLGYIDLYVPEGTDVTVFVDELEKSNLFEFVKYADVATISMSPNDSSYSNQWFLSAINMPNTWDITTGDSNVKVAVLDQEIDCNHQDIGIGYDNYKNIDASLGYNFKENTNLPVNPLMHGTFVAGIIGAKSNNFRGVAGITGGNHSPGVTIIPYGIGSILGDLYVDLSVVDDAILDAVDKGVKVINMSFGSESFYHPDIDDAILYAFNHGVTLVAATGNDYYSWIYYPASNPNVIAVGAINEDRKKCLFSQYGNGLDLVAPGENIYSTTIQNDYTYSNGTSFSAPQVSAVVALMLSVNPTLIPDTIRNILRSTCKKLPDYSFTSGWNNKVGYGLLDAYAALSSVDYPYGDTVLCGTKTYTVRHLSADYSVSWSIDSNSFSIYPSGNQCQVTYNDTLQYHVAHLTAAITLNGDTIATKSKRIVHHGSNLFVQGWQDEAITMNGTCPERTFTFPSDQYPEEEEEEDLSPGDGDGGLREITTPTRRPLWRVRRRADLAVGEGLDEVHYVYENINPNGGLRSGSLGYRDINGGNEVGLYSTFFDGMDISFYGANAPTAYRKVGNYVYFTMPYETDPYYVRLEAHSGGGCNDFELLFRVVPLESGEITGDPQLFVEYDGTYLRVVPEMDIEEPGNGQVTIPQWTLSIVNVSTGLVVYSQVINDIEAYVNVSGWPSGIYGINASSQSFSYNKRIRF